MEMYRIESLGSVVQSVGFKGLGLGLRMQPLYPKPKC